MERIRVYLVVYKKCTITPKTTEEFWYYPESGEVRIFENETITQILNFRYIRELVTSSPPENPPEPELDDSYEAFEKEQQQETPQPEPPLQQQETPTPPPLQPEQSPSKGLLQFCTCEDIPDPNCPYHSNM